MPKDWTMNSSSKGSTTFSDPVNPKGNNVRVRGGNPNSPNPAQQTKYVKQMKDGKMIDVNGKPTSSKAASSHIPADKYKFN